jgi:hypothetical protein
MAMKRTGLTTTHNFVGEGPILRKTLYVSPLEWSAILEAQARAIAGESRHVSANDIIRRALTIFFAHEIKKAAEIRTKQRPKTRTDPT